MHMNGVGGIPMTEIQACIALNNIIDGKDFTYMIYVLDREFLRLMSDKRKDQEDSEDKKGGSGGRRKH